MRSTRLLVILVTLALLGVAYGVWRAFRAETPVPDVSGTLPYLPENR
jgi:hypothetical protein